MMNRSHGRDFGATAAVFKTLFSSQGSLHETFDWFVHGLELPVLPPRLGYAGRLLLLQRFAGNFLHALRFFSLPLVLHTYGFS